MFALLVKTCCTSQTMSENMSEMQTVLAEMIDIDALTSDESQCRGAFYKGQHVVFDEVEEQEGDVSHNQPAYPASQSPNVCSR